MKKFLILLILIPIYSSAQYLYVIDKSTYRSIPYAIIMLDTTGYYTNEKGEFYVGNKKFDSISISHLSYETLKLHRSKIQDTLYLTSKAIDLGEVELLDLTKYKKKRVDTKSLTRMPILENTEVITCICSKSKKKTIRVASFYFKLFLEQSTNTDKDEYYYNAFRLNIYKNENFIPKEFLRTVDLIIFDNQQLWNKSYLHLDYNFGSIPLEIGNNGICFGLEHIAKNDNYQTRKFHFITGFSKKHKKFKAKSYQRHLLKNKNHLNPYDELENDLERGSKLMPVMLIYE